MLLRSLGFVTRPNTNVFQSVTRGIRRPAINQSQLEEGRRSGAIAMKVGMLTLYDKWGEKHAATVLKLDRCIVIRQKSIEKDGYTALQISGGEAKLKNVTLPVRGQYKHLNEPSGTHIPGRIVKEFHVTPDSYIPVGTQISALHFVPGQLVDCQGISKGKGFAGVMKRHNFSGGRATHGNSRNHRTPGSTGACQDPGKVWKGKKMPGRMGAETVTVQNLKVIKICPVRDLIFVAGGVPGPKGTFISVTDAVKGPFWPVEPPRPTFSVDNGSTRTQIPFDVTSIYGAADTGIEVRNNEIWAPVSAKDIGMTAI